MKYEVIRAKYFLKGSHVVAAHRTRGVVEFCTACPFDSPKKGVEIVKKNDFALYYLKIKEHNCNCVLSEQYFL